MLHLNDQASLFLCIGKGITDQDRNILSNQVMLLGFLRSASQFLKLGPVPEVHPGKGKSKQNEEDEEDEEAELGGQISLPPQDAACRGSVLITLRNVPPYTLW